MLVDEYQDTNGSQYRIVKALAAEHRNLCVVGDDDQSIYGWRGAEVAAHPAVRQGLARRQGRSAGGQLPLDRGDPGDRQPADRVQQGTGTTRCCRPPAPAASGRGFCSTNSETDEAQRDRGRHPPPDRERDSSQPRDFAILFRTNEQPRAFETELRKAKMPYVILGSQSFFDRKEVRDILAYLRVIDSPRDEVSLLRIINKPPRGIGEKTVETAPERRRRPSGEPMWDVLIPSSRRTAVCPARRRPQCHRLLRRAIASFVELIRRYHDDARPHPGPLPKGAEERRTLVDLVRRLIAEIGYEAELKRLYTDPQRAAGPLASGRRSGQRAAAPMRKAAKQPTLGGFIDEVALGQQDMGDDKDKQLANNAVALMTLHSAKGLEFPHVYMVGLEEGILPHHRSLKAGDDVEEERRLCYVGVTRAQERLTLSLSLTRMKWGKPRDTIPSRFLYEIMGQAEKAPGAKRRARQVRGAGVP